MKQLFIELQIGSKQFIPIMISHLLYRLFFYLPDAFPCQSELVANFFKRMLAMTT